MSILISGSLAYDYIMDFPDSFKNHILPDQIHILNVSFVVDKLKKNFGGTAGNIAYTMKLLGADPIIVGAIGTDADDYLKHFKKQHISTEYISVSKQFFSASAYITTDKDDNQITAFYPGAGGEGIEPSVGEIKEKILVTLISPTKKETMIEHSKQAYEKNIPIMFDPGQQITALNPRELSMLIGQAKILIANDYEMKLIESKTGWSEKELFDHVEVVITTLGEKGSRVATESGSFEIPPCPPQSVDDPTGAGDAYRAGFLAGYVRGFDLETCGQMGSVAATYAVEQYGTQNHDFIRIDFEKRYKETYDKDIQLA